MSKKPKDSAAAILREQQALIDAWAHPIGAAVIVRKDLGEEVPAVTRSAPWLMGGTALILLEGIRGGFALERVRLAPAEAPVENDDNKEIRRVLRLFARAVEIDLADYGPGDGMPELGDDEIVARLTAGVVDFEKTVAQLRSLQAQKVPPEDRRFATARVDMREAVVYVGGLIAIAAKAFGVVPPAAPVEPASEATS